MRSAIAVLGFCLGIGQAGAATFVVDNTQDSVFSAFTQCTNAPNDCSFRGAVGKVNANPDADVIAFNIPAATDPGCVAATGVCTLTPTVDTGRGIRFTSAVTIDGLTQSGASANSIAVPGGVDMQIKIQFNQALNANGIFHFRNSGTVRGIALTDVTESNVQPTLITFGEVGLPDALVESFNILRSYVIESCILGVDINTARVNDVYIPKNVQFDNTNGYFDATVGSIVPITARATLQYGGVLPSQRNWIPGGGALTLGSATTGVIASAPITVNFEGNLLGSTMDGNSPAQFARSAHVKIAQPQNPASVINIGGSTPSKRNVFLNNATIPGGTLAALMEVGSAPTNDVNPNIKIQGNYFGVAANGIDWFSHQGAIVGSNVVIGGTASGEGNVFVRSQFVGASTRLDPLKRTTYLGNTHFDSVGPGLIRGNSILGAIYDPNDLNDADAGNPNFPKIISSTLLAPNQLQVRYLIDSAPANTVYPILVEFYKANGNDASVLLGRDTYTGTEAQLEKTALFTLDPSVIFGADDIVLASSTPSDSGTSIFNWFGMFMSHLGNNQIQINSPTTFTVQALTDGPYAPRGMVKISVYDNFSTPNLLLTCNATLQPTSVGQSQASCAVPPGNNPIFSNPNVTFNLRAEYEIQEFPFASETGDRIQITRPVTVFRNDLFCHGFEDNSTGTCRALP